ncbi:hypothetical protein Aeqsu_2591 [Aequorivita sublithincola DSM 14238]|uniref:Yip1 domain-containing protein n=1 Tax=Aequorivita sublithincola (strain DSM 14238 / LMG 21431 / ACAM 643 / 9-3) TaxID=746697 RepID=I3YYH8_AEQSU|nr:YIP1 family protein [Aequorivita sublithincola]AFL82046.1 hypothetical protein Aeqsu_2591 [Aequorivita sublithincola DSM 14238]
MKSYKKWAFRILIFVVLLNILVFYLITDFTGNMSDEGPSITLLTILGFVVNLFFIGGIVLTILSIVKKEEKDYEFILSVAGYSLLILIPIALFFIP